MEPTRIILAGLWIASMLAYLWGDVLRLIAANGKEGEIFETQPTQGMFMFMAALMLIPIVMVVLTLILKYPAIRWVNIIVAIAWVIFTLAGFSGYPAHTKFILAVSFVFNGLTIWYAWNWVV